MSTEAAPPAAVGQYLIEGRLGRGGMGTVWLARHRVLGHHVALKQVPITDEPHARERALDEGRHAARLDRHPDIVAIMDVLEDEQHVWLVMEYVPSMTLAELIARHGPLEPGEAAWIGARVAGALAAAHERGILHRDVKPQNVLIRTDGAVVKLGDFGIAHRQSDPRLTSAGTIVGTLSYMAPEIARGNAPSEASDVFGLGVTLLQAVEGRAPYGEDAAIERLYPRVCNGQLIETDRVRRSPELAGLLQRMTHLFDDARVDAEFAADQLQEIATAMSGRTLAVLADHPPPQPVTAFAELVRAAPAPSRRPRRYAAAAAAAATVLATGAGIGIADPFGWRTPAVGSDVGSASAGAPTSDPVAAPTDPFAALPPIDGLSLDVDPRSVDPCRLLDTGALRAEPAVPGVSGLTSCSAAIDDVTVSVDIIPTSQTPSSTAPRRPTIEHGPATVSFLQQRRSPTSPRCGNNITLGAVNLYVSARYTRQPAGATDDATTRLCALSDDATAAALRTLAAGGLPVDPNRRSTPGLAAADACAVVDEARLPEAVPGISTRREPGYAGWRCLVGAQQRGRPFASVTFLLGKPDTPAERTVANLPAIVTRDSGVFNPTGCTVSVRYRPQAAWAPTRDERVAVAVDLPQDADACASAVALAESVVGRLQP